MTTTQFLNVDLEIAVSGDGGVLVEQLSQALFELHVSTHRGVTRANYETTKLTKTADATVRELVRVLGRLSPAARRSWRAARVRDFNIGIQCESEPRSFELAIEPATLASVVKLGGRMVVTVYAPDPPTGRLATTTRPRKAR